MRCVYRTELVLFTRRMEFYHIELNIIFYRLEEHTLNHPRVNIPLGAATTRCSNISRMIPVKYACRTEPRAASACGTTPTVRIKLPWWWAARGGTRYRIGGILYVYPDTWTESRRSAIRLTRCHLSAYTWLHVAALLIAVYSTHRCRCENSGRVQITTTRYPHWVSGFKSGTRRYGQRCLYRTSQH